MNETTRIISITARQAAHIIKMSDDEAVKFRDLGNRLIMGTNSRQAGFNALDAAAELDQLAFLVADAFPEIDNYMEDDDEG